MEREGLFIGCATVCEQRKTRAMRGGITEE